MKLTTVPLAILFNAMLNGALATESQEIISQAIPVPLPVWVETSVVLT